MATKRAIEDVSAINSVAKIPDQSPTRGNSPQTPSAGSRSNSARKAKSPSLCPPLAAQNRGPIHPLTLWVNEEAPQAVHSDLCLYIFHIDVEYRWDRVIRPRHISFPLLHVTTVSRSGPGPGPGRDQHRRDRVRDRERERDSERARVDGGTTARGNPHEEEGKAKNEKEMREEIRRKDGVEEKPEEAAAQKLKEQAADMEREARGWTNP
ncbi:DEAD-box ATP-dependent RNA helicase 21 [Morella rubra]|uniref:DEAD-box ATP-dependent RNA helicase 21 n=1 Tax=Morella rubra TaxID=262757 RepID=A0A6A1V718_9ROSI|nr:DEAD-box ATP-dependent RNA helicase 21 [Morella rubra]KAB1207688.1 DEAD-box ATP-dependent RNA helicase 21 [Morella rubra]